MSNHEQALVSRQQSFISVPHNYFYTYRKKETNKQSFSCSSQSQSSVQQRHAVVKKTRHSVFRQQGINPASVRKKQTHPLSNALEQHEPSLSTFFPFPKGHNSSASWSSLSPKAGRFKIQTNSRLLLPQLEILVCGTCLCEENTCSLTLKTYEGFGLYV